jgi:hypothetical protein
VSLSDDQSSGDDVDRVRRVARDRAAYLLRLRTRELQSGPRYSPLTPGFRDTQSAAFKGGVLLSRARALNEINTAKHPRIAAKQRNVTHFQADSDCCGFVFYSLL